MTIDALVEREHNRQRMAEVWSSMQKDAALVQGFPHKLVLLIVELEYGLLKVTYSAVDKLCRLAGCACTKVIPLDQCDLETARGGVDGNSSTRCAPSDNEQVVFVTGVFCLVYARYAACRWALARLQRTQHLGPGRRIPSRRKFPCTNVRLGCICIGRRGT
jgi:hypothetical protein